METLVLKIQNQVTELQKNKVVSKIADVIIKDKEFRDKLQQIIETLNNKNEKFDTKTLIPIIALVLDTIDNHDEIINDFSTIISGDTIKYIIYNILIDYKLIDSSSLSYEELEMLIDILIQFINNNTVFKKIKGGCMGCFGKKTTHTKAMTV